MPIREARFVPGAEELVVSAAEFKTHGLQLMDRVQRVNYATPAPFAELTRRFIETGP